MNFCRPEAGQQEGVLQFEYRGFSTWRSRIRGPFGLCSFPPSPILILILSLILALMFTLMMMMTRIHGPRGPGGVAQRAALGGAARSGESHAAKAEDAGPRANQRRVVACCCVYIYLICLYIYIYIYTYIHI